MKIAITGGSGLLGQTFKSVLSVNSDYKVDVFEKEEMDVTDPNSLYRILYSTRPDWMINCAAITNVDKVEIVPSEAFKVNASALTNIAQVANQLKIKVLHFSTDYVFDGKAVVPYSETSEPNPINQYGSSKLEGEKRLIAEMPRNAVVIRTEWLYGDAKFGFISDVIKRVEQGQREIRLVNDQVGQLTLASDVVFAALEIISRPDEFDSQIYHVTNQNFASWLEIGEFVNHVLKGSTRISGISSSELNRPAQRPKFSALNSKKFDNEFSPIRTWTEALGEYLFQNRG